MADDKDKPQITQSSNSNEPQGPDAIRISAEPIVRAPPDIRRLFGRPEPAPNKVSHAPAPPPPIDANGGSTEPPKNRIDQDREYSERLRGDIADAIRQSAEPEEAPQRLTPASGVESTSFRQKFWHYTDHAVLGLFELLGLLFGLPFGDDLYHDKPVSTLHLVYLVIGCVFAAAGPMFPLTREIGWLPKSFAPSISSAARDARTWIAVLLIFFLYGAAPDIYQRATQPNSIPTGFTQAQVNEKIAAATDPLKSQIASLRANLEEVEKQRDRAQHQTPTNARSLTGAKRAYQLGFDTWYLDDGRRCRDGIFRHIDLWAYERAS